MEITAEDAITENNGLIREKVWDYYLKRNKSAMIDPDDMYQAACEHIIRYIGNYDPKKAKLSTYVGYLAEMGIKRAYAQQTWEKATRLSNPDKYVIEGRRMHYLAGLETETHAAMEDTRQAQLDPELAIMVKDAIDKLSPVQRFIVLAVGRGYTYREIGSMLGKSYEWVRLQWIEATEDLNLVMGRSRERYVGTSRHISYIYSDLY